MKNGALIGSMCGLEVDLVFPSKPWAPSVHLVWVGLVTGVRTPKAKDGGGSQVVDSGGRWEEDREEDFW